MGVRRVVRETAATVVRSGSVVAFAAEVGALASTANGPAWATWIRRETGWRFREGLSDWGLVLAAACLVPSVVLAITDHPSPDAAGRRGTAWCVWLNAVTMVLALFVPAQP